MDDTRTPPPTPPAPYLGAGAQLPDVDLRHHTPRPGVGGEAEEVYGGGLAHAIQQAPAQLNFTPPQVPIAGHDILGVDDVLDLLDAGNFPQQGVFDLNMQPIQPLQPLFAPPHLNPEIDAALVALAAEPVPALDNMDTPPGEVVPLPHVGENLVDVGMQPLQLPQLFAFQQLNPLGHEEDLGEEPWVPGEDDVLDLDVAEPHALFAQLHLDPDEDEEEEEFNEEPWFPGPDDVLDLDVAEPQPLLAPAHLGPVVEDAGAALAEEPVPAIDNMDMPPGEVVPLLDVNENEGVVGAPAHEDPFDEAHQDADVDGDEHNEDLEVPDAPDLLAVQHAPIAIEANDAQEADNIGHAHPAAPAEELDEDHSPSIAESPLVRSRNLSLPPHITAKMAQLAATLSSDNAAVEDLYTLLDKACTEIDYLRTRLTNDQDQPARQANFIRRGLNAVARGVERVGIKKGWESLARKTRIGGNRATSTASDVVPVVV